MKQFLLFVVSISLFSSFHFELKKDVIETTGFRGHVKTLKQSTFYIRRGDTINGEIIFNEYDSLGQLTNESIITFYEDGADTLISKISPLSRFYLNDSIFIPHRNEAKIFDILTTDSSKNFKLGYNSKFYYDYVYKPIKERATHSLSYEIKYSDTLIDDKQSNLKIYNSDLKLLKTKTKTEGLHNGTKIIYLRDIEYTDSTKIVTEFRTANLTKTVFKETRISKNCIERELTSDGVIYEVVVSCSDTLENELIATRNGYYYFDKNYDRRIKKNPRYKPKPKKFKVKERTKILILQDEKGNLIEEKRKSGFAKERHIYREFTYYK